MAMRPRRGGGLQPRPSLRPTYESISPRYEWKYEDNVTILLLYLPGFVKEQIRMDFDKSRGLMQILGQRPLGAGRWAIFNQSFMIPAACDWTQINTQFGLGVLTITVPNKSSTPDQNVDAQPKTTPQQQQQQQLPTTTTARPPPPLEGALGDETTSSNGSSDHDQEREEPSVDDKKLDAMKEKTEATSSDDDHKLPRLEKVDGKKEVQKVTFIPHEKPPKAEEKDRMLEKGDAEEKVEAKNVEHERDVGEKGTMKSEEQALLINMVFAAVVLMGLGAYVFSIISSSKTA